jgi:hypothetical protein
MFVFAKIACVRICLEQPMSSLLTYIPPVEAGLDLLGARQQVTWLGAFGGTNRQ